MLYGRQRKTFRTGVVAQNVGQLCGAQYRVGGKLLVIVLFAANLLLNLFTRHNKHVEVPDFMNMTLDEALAASRGDKLRIEVNDSLYVPPSTRASFSNSVRLPVRR